MFIQRKVRTWHAIMFFCGLNFTGVFGNKNCVNFFTYNSVLDLIYQETNKLRGNKNKSGESFSTFSASVPGAVFKICDFIKSDKI